METIKPKLFTKNFILIIVANFFLFISNALFLPTLPIYVASELNGNEIIVGYVVGLLAFTSLFFRPIAGFIYDKSNRKNILIISLLANCVGVSLYFFAISTELIFIIRALHGVAWGFSTAGISIVATDIIPKTRRGEGIGLYGLSNTVAMAIGPIVGVFILHNFNYNVLFFSGSIAVFISLIFLIFVKYTLDYDPHKLNKKINMESFIEKKVLYIAVSMTLLCIGYGGIVSFITFRGKEMGIQNPGWYFLIYAIILFLIRPISGKIFDRHGPKIIMGVGFVASIFAYIMLATDFGAISFYGSSMLLGIGWGTIGPAGMSLSINMVDDTRRGVVNATIVTSFDLGIGIGAILLGFVSKFLGYSSMYLLCAAFMAIGMGVFYFWHKESNTRPTR